MDAERERCPFLVEVMADRLWVCPTTAYCRRGDARVRVPATTTLARLCTTAEHLGCSGYRAGMVRTEQACG